MKTAHKTPPFDLLCSVSKKFLLIPLSYSECSVSLLIVYHQTTRKTATWSSFSCSSLGESSTARNESEENPLKQTKNFEMMWIILANTALSISIFKGIARSILHVIGIRLSSSSSSSASPEDPRLCHPGSLLEEFRNQTPTLRFISLCRCKKQPNLDHDCTVCLTKFEPESGINKLKCGHLFHKMCLEKWIDYWNITVPLSRTSLVPEEKVSSWIW
ncbi:PREDICTED: probable E3 ubiquitin-protein ligase XERICO [Tarenaya hassleriana]|uniref:probable E3 ubiquitin-protein ligase XERICO n=1 Tax=Tarenaya hassleriana TaxID=28532 RepID=UPI00053C2EA3|nr:PREDICTED: probable E3 ubiquitin-protein ligase XERICO [Tarenaya hassleriana]